MEIEKQNQTSSISSIKSFPAHFKFRYKYQPHASQGEDRTSGATKHSDQKGQRFDAELNLLLTTNVHHKIFIALVSYYTSKYSEVPNNPRKTSNQESKKSQSKSKKGNDLNKLTQVWKQKIYKSDDVSPNDNSSKTKVESIPNNEDKPSIVIDIDLEDSKSTRHKSKVSNIKSQPAPKNIQERGNNGEYFWTHHGNELSFNEKSIKKEEYEIEVKEENGLIILDIFIKVESNLQQSLEKTKLYLTNLSLSQANIKQKSDEQIEQDTTQFLSNIEKRLTSQWSNSIKPNPFNNNDLAKKNLKSIKPDPYEPLHLYAQLIPYQEVAFPENADACYALSPPIYNCPTKNFTTKNPPTTIMTFPYKVSRKGSSNINENKVVLVTKQLPKFIVPPGTLLEPTNPRMELALMVREVVYEGYIESGKVKDVKWETEPLPNKIQIISNNNLVVEIPDYGGTTSLDQTSIDAQLSFIIVPLGIQSNWANFRYINEKVLELNRKRPLVAIRSQDKMTDVPPTEKYFAHASLIGNTSINPLSMEASVGDEHRLAHSTGWLPTTSGNMYISSPPVFEYPFGQTPTYQLPINPSHPVIHRPQGPICPPQIPQYLDRSNNFELVNNSIQPPLAAETPYGMNVHSSTGTMMQLQSQASSVASASNAIREAQREHTNDTIQPMAASSQAVSEDIPMPSFDPTSGPNVFNQLYQEFPLSPKTVDCILNLGNSGTLPTSTVPDQNL